MRLTEFIFLLLAVAIVYISALSRTMIPEYLDVQKIELTHTEQIIGITDSLVVPVLYDTLLIDHYAPIERQKELFVNQVLPAVLIVKYQLEKNIKRIENLIQTIEREEVPALPELAFADSLKELFRASSYQNLITRMKPHSNSLVLAQAVVESGWGRSRFAAEGNNLFGVWTTRDDEFSLPSLGTRSGKQVYLKKYDTVLESVDHYFLNIGRHNAYRNFRMKRIAGGNNYELIAALSSYSEEGSEYLLMLRKIISWNNFEKFDNHIIHPNYIINESKLDSYMNEFGEKLNKLKN